MTAFSSEVSNFSTSGNDWIQMQVQWIVWTLASHERRRVKEYLGKLLTFQNVLVCLKHRYLMYTERGSRASPAGVALQKNPSRSKFRNQIMMSPLQRSSEIRTFLSPLVVCVSVRRNEEDDSYQMQITDGWWWVSVLPDHFILDKLLKTVSLTLLLALCLILLQGALTDGCKVVIFGGTFEESNDSNGKVVMKLFYNAIKRAQSKAKIGYIHPSRLMRTLSISSLLPGLPDPSSCGAHGTRVVDGGPIFSVGLRVLYLSPVINKIFVPVSDKPSSYSLNEAEMEIITQLQEIALERERSLFEDDSSLTLPSLLEEINCSPQLKKLILVCVSPSSLDLIPSISCW
jgi:hypothetical protein